VSLDARRCLTDAALAALAVAPVGKAPPEVAGHLAGCARCQHRLLAADRASTGETRADGERKPYRNLMVFGVVLLATLLLLGITLVLLSGR